MTPAFESSHFILAVVMGAGAAIGLLHLWLWSQGRREISHIWIAAFCVTSVVFQAGRYLEVQSVTPEQAIFGARIQVGAIPAVVFCLMAFARSLSGDIWKPSHRNLYILLTALLTGLGLFTDFMISDRTFEDRDWFGHHHMSPEGGPGMVLIGLFAFPAYFYLVHAVKRSPKISQLEARVVIGSVAIFATFGILTIVSSLGIVRFPAMAHYGPLVIAGGLSFLLVHQHGRMREELESMAEERARRLHETGARYQQLVDSSPVGIVALDSDGHLLAVNPRLCAMMAIPVDLIDQPGVRELSVFDLPAMELNGAAALLRSCIESGRPLVDELEFVNVDDIRLTLRLDVAPIRDSAGSVVGVQAIVEDIGERELAEEQLRQSKKMESIGGLAAGIAHEINNPMSYVRANLQMLRDEWKELREVAGEGASSIAERLSECEELIEDALEGVERTVRIVREVNEFSHGTGGQNLEVRVNELMMESLRVAERQIGDGVKVNARYDEVPSLRGSPGQLSQVFLNLIVNAVHALDGAGELTIETEYDARDGEVVARVSDDGSGIPEEVVDRIFDPFFTTKEAGEGTGLGLYISYEIVRMHDGRLVVTSGFEGTTVEVRLPVGDSRE